MKRIVFIIGVFVYVCQINAQIIVEKRFDFSQGKNISIDLQIADSIKISTWNKNEVYAKASVNINDNKDNDKYETTFDDSGTELKIDAGFKKEFMNRNNNCLQTEICWEICIPENAVFSVKTINGNITITGKTSEIKAHTISGFVDLTIPKDKKANFSCKTITGTFYSNHNFVAKNTGKSHHPNIYEEINGGGSTINLETISGDIFFREIK